MSKEKISFVKLVTHWFTFHFWLKLISLALSIVIWLYVRGEINRFNF